MKPKRIHYCFLTLKAVDMEFSWISRDSKDTRNYTEFYKLFPNQIKFGDLL